MVRAHTPERVVMFWGIMTPHEPSATAAPANTPAAEVGAALPTTEPPRRRGQHSRPAGADHG